MKKVLFSVFVIAFAAMTAFSQAVAEGVPVTKEGHEVFATITKWADAVKNRNVKQLDELFAEDLIVTTFEGETRGKEEEIEKLKPRENMQTHSVKNEDIKVRIYGTAAVVTALVKMDFIMSEHPAFASYRYTAVFVKKEGRWQLVALQTAPSANQPNKAGI